MKSWLMKSFPRRLLILVCLIIAIALAWGGGTWWYRSTQPDNRLRLGQEALSRGDLDEAQRLVLVLKRAGHKDYANLLHAEILYSQGQSLQALNALDRIQDEGALRLQAATLGGWCFLQERNLHEAARHFHFVLDHWPEHLSAHRGLAKVYYHQGAMTQAMRYLEEVVRLDPSDGLSWQFLGHIYKDLGNNRDRAITCYREALRC